MSVKILSLFDGMACGMIAMQNAGLEVEEYIAYEIDKYAIKTSIHNFPQIKQCGDVFEADFTQYEGVDYVIGGSPCTYWSIAQKNNRETEASGMGWELFCQYVRAIKEAKPKFFIYENNKSMSKAIRESITKTFGFEPVCINSALVSAQNRQRLYWVGRRNADGTYSMVDVTPPADRGILLKDVLDGAADRNKARAVIGSIGRTTPREYFIKSRGTTSYEPVNPLLSGKSRCLTANYANKGAKHILESNYSDNPCKQQWDSVAEPVNITSNGKSHTIKAQYYKNGLANFVCNGGFGASSVAEPVCVAQRGRYNKELKTEQHFEVRQDGKTNVLTTVQKDNNVCEPVRVGGLPRPNGELSNSQAMRVYSTNGKSVNLVSGGGGMGAKTGLYAIPIETADGIPTKAMSGTDGKTYPVYEVKNGLITIKDKQYPIKLCDGYYIIRKLTVSECKRLQTVPEWYEFPVSDSQAYKMLGNGWTCDVITHLIRATLNT